MCQDVIISLTKFYKMMPTEYVRYTALLETPRRTRRDQTERIILRQHKVLGDFASKHLLKKFCKSFPYCKINPSAL